MKKPCGGEKTGLKTELRILSPLLFALFLFSETYSQIPINGFCKYNSFVVDKNFTSLYPINFNKDSQTDLLLFDSQAKNIVSLVGDKGGSFGKKIRFFIPYEVNNLYNISDNAGRVTSCVFTSRKNRAVGFYDFNSYGRPVVKGFFKFDSYPENISYENIDGSKNKSFLVSGSAFNGLSLLKPDRFNHYKETKIVKNLSFRKAIFIDVTNDGYPDIVASNILTRSLDFYYNNGSGDFSKIRSIKINDEIKSLQSFDMNLDQYPDIIFSSKKSVNIFYGDSVGSYETHISVPTNYTPDKIVLADFNRDGFIDIGYINKTEGTFSVLFAKSDGGFYPEVVFLKKDGLSDVSSFYSKFVNGVILLSNNGFVYTITNLSTIFEDVSLTFGAEPGAVTYFDLDNNGIIDIAFIDERSNSLKLVVRNNSGIPWMLYKINLFEKHTNIIAENKSPQDKIFYCYTPGKKIIEVIEKNFETGKINRNSLYTAGGISDIINYTSAEGSDKIIVSYLNKGKLGVSAFNLNNSVYNSTDYPDIDSDVISSNLAFAKTPELFYWKTESGNQALYGCDLSDNFKEHKKYFGLSLSDTTLVNSFAGDVLNKDEVVSVNFFETQKNDFAMISSLKNPSVIVSSDLLNHFRIKNKNQLFFGELKPGGLNKLFIYRPIENGLHKVDFVNKGKKIIITKILEATGLTSYFIKNMNSRNYHFVYTDSSDGSINIRQLGK